MSTRAQVPFSSPEHDSGQSFAAVCPYRSMGIYYPSSIPEISCSVLLLAGAVLFCFALAFRLYGNSADAIQPDELHWLMRSHVTLEHLRHGQWAECNAHLGHPGVPPSALMTAVEWAVEKFNARNGKADDGDVDMLTALRSANAIVSSLVIPLVLVSGAMLIGFEAALLSALLLLVNPTHIALSRLAHLDAMLTLFVTGALLFYALGEKKNRSGYTLIAGMFWGCGIATKPTAGFLLPGLLAYRFIRRALLKKHLRVPLIRWIDVWAIFIGHAVFGLTYTRLWQENSRYVYKFHIQNFATRTIETLGGFLHPAFSLPLAILAIIWGSSGLLRESHPATPGYSRHLRHAVLLLGLIGGILSLNPEIPANLVRYWLWGAGLGKMEHVAYGRTWEAPEFGYLGMYLTKLPLLIVAGIGASFLSLLAMARNEEVETREQSAVYALCLVSAIFWTFLLSLSSKQTLRYAAPVIPGLYVLGGFGILSILQQLPLPFARESRAGIFGGGTIYSLILFAVQAGLTLSWFPNVSFFSNVFSLGLESDIEAGRPLPVAGTNEGIDFLQRESARDGRPLTILVLGDMEVLSYSYRRRYPEKHKELEFLPASNLALGDYLLTFPGFQSEGRELVAKQGRGLEIAFSYQVRGSDVLTIHRVSPPDYTDPIELELSKMFRSTGRNDEFSDGTTGVVAQPGRDTKGFLAFGRSVHFGPGSYTVTFPLASMQPITPEALGSASAKNVVRLQLGRVERVITLEELSRTDIWRFGLSFVAEKNVSLQLRIYWYGRLPVFIGNPVLARDLSTSEAAKKDGSQK